MAGAPRYRFGLFELDLGEGELRFEDRRTPLQDLPLRLLGVLVRNPGRIVSRRQLREELWPEDLHVDFEGSLNAAVRRLREALGESATEPRYVETVPRRGYRFLAPVTEVTATAPVTGRADPASDETGDSGPRKEPRGRWWPLVVGMLGLTLWLLTARFGPRPALPEESQMIAVLPLEVLGQDTRLPLLAAGLTEELIVRLGQAAPEHLGVVASSSARRAGDENPELAAIARRLGVTYVVEGTLRAEGQLVRVSARLVKAEDRSLQWSASFDRDLGSILDLERELAERVVDGVRRELFDGASLSAAPATRPEVGAVAFEHYLRGRYFLGLQTPEGFLRAAEELRAALDREPDFADGWASLAQAHAMIGIYDLRRPHDAFPEAEVAVSRALSLEPQNVEALLARAIVDATYHWRWSSAQADLRRVVGRWPNHVTARRWLGLALATSGRHQEAAEQLEAARLLDPLSLTVHTSIGWSHFLAGRLEAAIAATREVLELDPSYLVAWDDLKWYYTVAGRDQEAAEAFFHVVALEGEPAAVPGLRWIYGERGFRGLLEESLEAQLKRAAAEAYQSPYDIALTLAALGRVDEAAGWLERSFAEREVDLVGLALDPRMRPLHGHPDFEALVARLRAGEPP